MFLFNVPTFFKKGDIIQGGTLFKGGHYLRKYGMYFIDEKKTFIHWLIVRTYPIFEALMILILVST